MTEAEWLADEDARAIADCLLRQHNIHARKNGRRKVRLFGCASCRLFWNLLTDPRSRAAVEYAEQLADGVADVTQWLTVREHARACAGASTQIRLSKGPLQLTETEPQLRAPEGVVNLVQDRVHYSLWAHWAMTAGVSEHDSGERREWLAQLRTLSHLLRDIFGNPCRPVRIDPSWRTGTAVSLASQMYESRDFGAMPILADALQDAGCDNEDILSHCRDPQVTHVRGCWVVDLVLGKE